MMNGIYTPTDGPGPIGQDFSPGAQQLKPKIVPGQNGPAHVNKATPISMLQELCQKLNKQPRYDLLTMEGRAHQPSFVFRCTVGDVTGEGHGTSKKAGKHQAAENVLNQLKAGIVPGEEKPEVKSEIPENVSLSYGGEINPVGTLQELVVSRGWRLPDYSLASEAGPAHKKEFIICCAVEKLKEYGNGSSKKAAKRNAATAMLTKLKEIPVDSKEHIVDNDDLDTSFPTRGSRGFLPIEMLRNQNGERILLDKTETTIHEPLQLLNEYAQKHLFKIEFLDIVERSTCGLFQCLLRLHTLPVSVVHGQGATVQDSHVEAARNALQYLKIMATEKGLTNQMTGLNREKGLEKSDEGALNPEQRSKLRQLKVDVQKLDEKYIREHPELDVIIYEFMREVLHRRPNDFNAFAADWFSNPKLKSHIDARMAKGNPPRDLGWDRNYLYKKLNFNLRT